MKGATKKKRANRESEDREKRGNQHPRNRIGGFMVNFGIVAENPIVQKMIPESKKGSLAAFFGRRQPVMLEFRKLKVLYRLYHNEKEVYAVFYLKDGNTNQRELDLQEKFQSYKAATFEPIYIELSTGKKITSRLKNKTKKLKNVEIEPRNGHEITYEDLLSQGSVEHNFVVFCEDPTVKNILLKHKIVEKKKSTPISMDFNNNGGQKDPKKGKKDPKKDKNDPGKGRPHTEKQETKGEKGKVKAQTPSPAGSSQACIESQVTDPFVQHQKEPSKRKIQGDDKPVKDIVEKPKQEETVQSEGGEGDPLQQDERADSSDSDKKVPFERSDGATDALRGSKQDECESASIHDIIKCAVKKDWLQKAVTSATIGHKGGKIELHNFEVIVPSGAISEEIEFEMSIDNNPENYPRNDDPLTPILQVDPHVNFDRPVTVRMRTYVSAAAGELLHASILYRDGSTDSSWMHFEDVVISGRNEVKFTVRHFTDFLAIFNPLIEWLGISRPVYHSFINAYIQKKNGTILVIHVKDSKTAETLTGGLENRGYLQIIPLPKPVESTVSSEIPVQIECEKPSGVTYDQCMLERLSQPYQYVESRAKDFSKKSEENFEGKLFIKLSGKEVPPLNLFTDWQPVSGSSHSTACVGAEGAKTDRPITIYNNNSYGDSQCDKRQTRTAQYMADSGGVVNNTQNGGSNFQNESREPTSVHISSSSSCNHDVEHDVIEDESWTGVEDISMDHFKKSKSRQKDPEKGKKDPKKDKNDPGKGRPHTEKQETKGEKGKGVNSGRKKVK